MVSRWLEGDILPTMHLEGIASYLRVEIQELFAVEPGGFSRQRELSLEEWLRGLCDSLGYTIEKKHTEEPKRPGRSVRRDKTED